MRERITNLKTVNWQIFAVINWSSRARDRMLLRLSTKTVDVVMGFRGFIEEWG